MIEPDKIDDMAETTNAPGSGGRSQDGDDEMDFQMEVGKKLIAELQCTEEFIAELQITEDGTSDIDKAVPFEGTSDIDKTDPFEESATVTATGITFSNLGPNEFILDLRDIADRTETEKETKIKEFKELLLRLGRYILACGRTLSTAQESVNEELNPNVKKHPWLKERHQSLVVKERSKDLKARIEQLDSKDIIYTMSEGGKNVCLIIANSKFANESANLGACAVDCLYLSALFKGLNFVVKQEENLQAEQMWTFLQNQKSQLEDIECFACVITSHGEREGVLGSDNKVLKFQEILDEFDSGKCNQLANKPKLFLFDVCRAKKNDDESKTTKEDPTDSIMIPPTKSDILVAYATSNDDVAFCYPEYGSWFSRCFVNVVSDNACSCSILDMLLMVNRLVGTFASKERRRQSGQFECSMRKQFFFSVPVIRQEEAKAADEPTMSTPIEEEKR